MSVINKEMVMIMAAMFKEAILDDDTEFFNTELGENISYMMQQYSNHSFEYLKNSIKNAYQMKTTKLEEIDSEDLKTMTIAELSKKYGKPEQTIRNYLNRKGLTYKKMSDTSKDRWIKAESELSSFNGMYTVSQICGMKGFSFSGFSYNKIKEFMDTHKIPYRSRVVC